MNRNKIWLVVAVGITLALSNIVFISRFASEWTETITKTFYKYGWVGQNLTSLLELANADKALLEHRITPSDLGFGKIECSVIHYQTFDLRDLGGLSGNWIMNETGLYRVLPSGDTILVKKPTCYVYLVAVGVNFDVQNNYLWVLLVLVLVDGAVS